MRLLTSSSGRRLALIVLVAALVALAGCSGGGNGTADPSETTDAPAEDVETTDAGDTSGEEMTTVETSEPGDSGTGDDGSSGDGTDDGSSDDGSSDDGSSDDGSADDGSSDDGTDDGSSDDGSADDGTSTSEVLGAHSSTLRDAGSFTAMVDLNSATPEANTTANMTIMIDVDAGEGYQQINVSSDLFGGSTTVYTTGNETYQRTTSDFAQEPQYNYQTAPYTGGIQPVNVSTGSTNMFLAGNSDISWSESGSATVNGFDTTRYTASGTDAIPDPSAIVGSEVSSIDTIEVNAFVDGEGVIRRMTVDFTGGTQEGGTVSQSLTYEITAIGSTTVPTPDWLEEARNSGN